MTTPLDLYQEQPTTLFEGKVKRIEYYTTARDDKYLLVFIRGVEKPLAIPEKMKLERAPTHGDQISALDVTEGNEFYFIGHRSVVTVKPADFEVWKNPTKMDENRYQQAETYILSYAEEHNGEFSAADVRDFIWSLFPERDHHIVGGIILKLAAKGKIHEFGYVPPEDPTHHGSKIPKWHLTTKK